MRAITDLAPLAPIPRRARLDRGANGPANPRRVRSMVEVTVYDAEAHARGEHPFRRVECEVMVRALSPAIAGLPLPLQEAVAAYAKAVEEVEAGGASDPEARTGGGGGGAAKEGRQFHAVRQVEFWRRLDRAVGDGAVNLGPVKITHRALLRAVALDGLAVSQMLDAMGLPRSNARRLAMLAGVIATATALAAELGLIEDAGKKKAVIRKKAIDGSAQGSAGSGHGADGAPGEKGSR